MPLFDWTEVSGLASNDPGKTITLSDGSAAIILAALAVMSSEYHWITDDFDAVEEALGIAAQDITTETSSEEVVMQTGTIAAFAGEPGDEWLLCAGQNVLRTEETQALYDHLHDVFIVNDDYFTPPDLRTRVIVGQQSGTTFEDVGDTGGAEVHTLTVDQMPIHVHTYQDTRAKPGTSAWVTASGIAEIGEVEADTGTAGGDESHNNLQPYMALKYWIKL